MAHHIHRGAQAAALGLLAALALGACQSSNRGLRIGGEVELASLDPAAPEVGPVSSEPSLMGVARDNWQPRVVTVPVDQVWHTAVYGVSPAFTGETARQRGEHPTEATVLEMAGDASRGRRMLEGLAAPLYGLADVVLLPVRMVHTPPWALVSSPREAYERSPWPGGLDPA